MEKKLLKLIAIGVLFMYLCSCTRTYYATESWKAKSSRKELTIKAPKQKHTFKDNGSYF